jgi:cell volume regulation protein A
MSDQTIRNDLAEIHVAPGAPAVGRQVVDLHLPPDVLIVLIGRGGDMLVPRGGTVIEAGDIVLVMAPAGAGEQLRSLLGVGSEALAPAT